MNVNNILPLILIGCVHFIIINPIEKMLVYTYADVPEIRRPNKECEGVSNLRCLGMPSGHSETVVVLCLILYKLKIISLPVCGAIIGIIGLERVYAIRHTISQVLAGWGVGFLYSMMYLRLWNKKSGWMAFAASVVFAFILSLILTIEIDRRVHEPVPEWVDPSLLPIIKKKQEATFMIKYTTTMVPLGKHNLVAFYNWSQLERMLDGLIDKIHSKKIEFDIIVGIKSGGAIISSYIQSKMPNKQLYFLKSKREYGDNIYMDAYNKNILERTEKMVIVEGIDDNISNKSVLLLDELLYSGQTMQFIKEYLYNEKKVKHVSCAVISSPETAVSKDILYYSNIEYGIVWPWGYDN